MFGYSVVSTSDGLFEVVDDLGTVIEVFDSRAPAHAYMRSLAVQKPQTPASRVVIGSRYGNKPIVEHVEETESEEVADGETPVKHSNTESSSDEIELMPIEPTGKRNSDSVREAIAYAKANYFSEKAVIYWATVKLGMKKALASSYVKGNWHRA